LNIDEFRENMLEYMKRMRIQLNSTFSGIASKYGLTQMQMQILLKLYEDGSHTISSLANTVGAFGANISPICKKMEADGLILRKRKQEDERVVLLELTEKGYLIAREIDQYFNNLFTEIMQKIDEDSLLSIMNGIKKFTRLLEATGNTDTGMEKQ